MASTIGIFTAVISFQYADAISNEWSTQCSGSSLAPKCSQKDNTPFLLPFPWLTMVQQKMAKTKSWKNGKVLNVLGQQDEPICTYYRCHHKLSVHGTRTCRCKHPMNKILGILMGYDWKVDIRLLGFVYLGRSARARKTKSSITKSWWDEIRCYSTAIGPSHGFNS